MASALTQSTKWGATPATTNYTANTLNQYTAVGSTTPTYDGNGNLTSNGSHTYAYDPENRLLTATQGGNTATYQYDAQGRRKSRTSGGTTTLFVTDADNREVLEYDGSTGAVLRWYAYGLGPNEVLGQMNVPAGTRTMPIPGMLGSIVGSVDASTGAISKASYLPYGGSAAPTSPFAFTGQRFDSEAGLYYYRARHYSTAYGRFLQTDPVGYDAGANLYAYVSNDPLNLIDPNGLLSLSGVLRFAGGSAEVAIGLGFGAVTSWTGIGAIAGGAIALHGLDVAYAALQGTDTFTSQGLQAVGVPQNAANAIDVGISGAAFIAAGAPVLPYSLFGPAVAGGGAGTSLLSATARGYVPPISGLSGTVGESSGPIWNALSSFYNTGSQAGIVGRMSSGASVTLGVGLESYSAYSLFQPGSAQAATPTYVGGRAK